MTEPAPEKIDTVEFAGSAVGSGVGVAEGASARGSSAGMRCTETRAVQLQSSAAASTRAAIFLYMI